MPQNLSEDTQNVKKLQCENETDFIGRNCAHWNDINHWYRA